MLQEHPRGLGWPGEFLALLLQQLWGSPCAQGRVENNPRLRSLPAEAEVRVRSLVFHCTDRKALESKGLPGQGNALEWKGEGLI